MKVTTATVKRPKAGKEIVSCENAAGFFTFRREDRHRSGGARAPACTFRRLAETKAMT